MLVLYPKPEKAFESIYSATLTGIGKQVKQPTIIEIPESAGLNAIQPEIDRHHSDKIIALSHKAADMLSNSRYRTRMLAGLMYFSASQYSGVSLALDSQVLKAQLNKLTPQIKRVFIVQESHRRTIAPLPSAITTDPLLVMRESDDLLTNMRTIGQLLEQEVAADDAILLPAHIPKDILYEVSKIAWDKHIMLLSTNLSHLEYGAMLAFYPDLVAFGEQLGELAQHELPVYETVRTVSVSLNQRVAQHLGVEFNASQLKLFSAVIQ